MKAYIVIITEDNGDYQFDYLCNNPWQGNFRDVIYGDSADEIVSNNGDYEGLFYQLYETNKGERIGYGVFNYDTIFDDIKEYVKKNGIIIDDDLYMVKSVRNLAAYVVSNLNYDGIRDLTSDDHNFIDCDFCTIGDVEETESLEKIVKNSYSWHGIKKIDIGFSSSDLDIAVDYYGGGCLQTTSLNYNMSNIGCIELIKEIIMRSFADNGDCVEDDTLLLVGVKGAGENEK